MRPNILANLARFLRSQPKEGLPNTYIVGTVLDMINLLSVVIFTGIDTPYIGFPLVFLLSLGDRFPLSPPQGCGILPRWVSSRIHPNIYPKRDQPFDENFCGVRLTPEQNEALMQFSGSGVKLCREEVGGWNNGIGWAANGRALEHLCLSFMGAFNSINPLENEPNFGNCRGTAESTRFNEWVEGIMIDIYTTPYFWHNMFSQELIQESVLVQYFAREADAIFERVKGILGTEGKYQFPSPTHPYTARDGVFSFGKMLEMDGRENLLMNAQVNFQILKTLMPTVPQSLPAPVPQQSATKRVFETPETKREHLEVIIAQSLDVDAEYPFVFPSKPTLDELERWKQTVRMTEGTEFKFWWRPTKLWDPEVKWAFPGWNLIAVHPKK